MKTLREIQNEVAKEYGYESRSLLFVAFRVEKVTYTTLGKYLNDVCLQVQKQAQHKINKRVEDDYLNNNFDSQSIINDNNLIR